MMIEFWGQIPAEAWDKVTLAYGKSAVQAFTKGIDFLASPKYFASCCEKLKLDVICVPLILPALKKELESL